MLCRKVIFVWLWSGRNVGRCADWRMDVECFISKPDILIKPPLNDLLHQVFPETLSCWLIQFPYNPLMNKIDESHQPENVIILRFYHFQCPVSGHWIQ